MVADDVKRDTRRTRPPALRADWMAVHCVNHEERCTGTSRRTMPGGRWQPHFNALFQSVPVALRNVGTRRDLPAERMAVSEVNRESVAPAYAVTRRADRMGSAASSEHRHKKP